MHPQRPSKSAVRLSPPAVFLGSVSRVHRPRHSLRLGPLSAGRLCQQANLLAREANASRRNLCPWFGKSMVSIVSGWAAKIACKYNGNLHCVIEVASSNGASMLSRVCASPIDGYRECAAGPFTRRLNKRRDCRHQVPGAMARSIIEPIGISDHFRRSE